MDAVEYLKEAKRMCDTVGDCRECPLNSSNTVIPCKLVRDNWELTNPEKIVAIVEKWALEHPKKTRQSEFLKMFPNAKLGDSGILWFFFLATLTRVINIARNVTTFNAGIAAKNTGLQR